MALTSKQEAFCQAVVSGMNQADAYRSAYNAANMKPEAVHVKSCELIKNGKVTVRIQELQSKLENKQLWTREMSVKALINAYKEGNPPAKVSAVKELNIMHGYNAPQKLEVTHKKNIADMTDEELSVYHQFLEKKDNE